LFTLFSYFMDGFAYAGEALTGRYIGARRSDELRLMIHRLFRISRAFAATVISPIAEDAEVKKRVTVPSKAVRTKRSPPVRRYA
ncbi:MATE family efflux transporter, partial [Porphyromonas gingivalis]